MGGSTNFIRLLKNIAWFRHVPFGTPPLLKCVHHERTFVTRNISFILSEYSFFSVSQLHGFKILQYTCNKIKSRVLSSVAVSDWTLLVLTLSTSQYFTVIFSVEHYFSLFQYFLSMYYSPYFNWKFPIFCYTCLYTFLTCLCSITGHHMET